MTCACRDGICADCADEVARRRALGDWLSAAQGAYQRARAGDGGELEATRRELEAAEAAVSAELAGRAGDA